MKSVLFVGFGKMGSIIADLFQEGEFEVFAVDPHLKEEGDFTTFFHSHEQLPEGFNPNIIVFAVKPQSIKEAIKNYTQYKSSLIISILAGTKISFFEEHFPTSRIIRLMPNIGFEVGKGMTLAMMNSKCMTKDEELINDIFAGRSMVIRNEELFHSATAISGSGIAFLAIIFKSIIDFAKENEISEKGAEKMTISAFESLACLLEKSTPDEIIKKISSKGGTTEAGVEVLNKSIAAVQKSKDLSI
jgi:pyrroline-5-carboxylate reductase